MRLRMINDDPLYQDRLQSEVTFGLRDVAGHRLLAVRLWTRPGSELSIDLAATRLRTAGEIELFLARRVPLLVGWAENSGWDRQFSVTTRTLRAFLERLYVPVDASESTLFARSIGKTILTCEVLSARHSAVASHDAPTPMAIRLRLENGDGLVFGCGDRQCVIAEGDNVIAARDGDMLAHADIAGASTIWSSDGAR